MSRHDADTLLRRALERSADAAGVTLIIERSEARRWASATFAGARHQLGLAVELSPAAEEWLAGLPEADLPLRDHLVADLKVVTTVRDGDRLGIVIEVLTVAER